MIRRNAGNGPRFVLQLYDMYIDTSGLFNYTLTSRQLVSPPLSICSVMQ